MFAVLRHVSTVNSKHPSTEAVPERDSQLVPCICTHLLNRTPARPQYTSGEARAYTSTQRDALLASFLDGVRGSGNRDVHVRMTPLELGRRHCPLTALAGEEVESSHLKFLTSPPPGLSFAEAVSRFNANVSYSGLTHAVTQEHLFAENKEKLIHSALQVVELLSVTLHG